MKKMIFAIALTTIGLIFTAFSFIWAAINPCDYNGITGLYGAFLGADMLLPFIISLVVMISGVLIMFYESYLRGILKKIKAAELFRSDV